MSIREITRPGWTRLCPKCRKEIRYTVVNIWNAPEPFFYCNTCNNVLLRGSDSKRAPIGDPSDPEHLAASVELWESIVQDAPACPCGGHFGLWSNVKCPSCAYEFPYNYGVKSVLTRILDSAIVVIEGATVVGDGPNDSWIARVKVPRTRFS